MLVAFYRKARKVLLISLGIWMGICWLKLISSFFSLAVDTPRWLRVPWSDFGDFAETPDGRVYVDIKFYSRVLCYDHYGNFIASYLSPVSGGDTGLAADTAGRIYYRQRNTVHIFNDHWQRIGEVSAADSANRTWILNPAGQPEYSPRDRDLQLPDHAAAPGELLFADTGRRQSHRALDGTNLNRRHNSLIRRTEAGQTIATYGTPWVLVPIVFPIPGGIGCGLTFLWAFFVDLKRNRIPLPHPDQRS
jgi:hypothetical protein